MDHLRRSLLNTFVVEGFDHSSEKRSEEQWLSQQYESDAIIFLMWRGQSLVRPRSESSVDDASAAKRFDLVQFKFEELKEIGINVDTIFLGQTDENKAVFAAIVDNDRADVDQELIAFGEFIDLRKAGSALNPFEGAIFAQAKALGEWHDRTRFCPRCGSALKPRHGGHVLRCTSNDCGRDHFPRLDPAIIVRVNIDDRILLGRQAVWAPHQYSVIAGFAEPGESLEQSVAREIFEETGIPVSEVHYQSSQPWPFPSNMMLGYSAIASHDRIQPNDEELEDARWFTRHEMIESLSTQTLRVPPALSISFRLIEDWFNQGDNDPLADIVTRTGTQWVPPPLAS